jgi:hypothetical protein
MASMAVGTDRCRLGSTCRMGAFCRQTEVALTSRRTTRHGYPCAHRDVVVGLGQREWDVGFDEG